MQGNRVCSHLHKYCIYGMRHAHCYVTGASNREVFLQYLEPKIYVLKWWAGDGYIWWTMLHQAATSTAQNICLWMYINVHTCTYVNLHTCTSMNINNSFCQPALCTLFDAWQFILAREHSRLICTAAFVISLLHPFVPWPPQAVLNTSQPLFNKTRPFIASIPFRNCHAYCNKRRRNSIVATYGAECRCRPLKPRCAGRVG